MRLIDVDALLDVLADQRKKSVGYESYMLSKVIAIIKEQPLLYSSEEHSREE